MHEGRLVQQINLLDQGFRQKRTALSAQMMAGVTVLLIFSMAIFYLYAKSGIPSLKDQLAQLESQMSRMQAQLEKISDRTAEKEKTTELERKIARLVEQKRNKSGIVNLLAGRALGNTSGFSAYLESLARQITPDIWLREIKIIDGGAQIALVGSTMNPELVPTYLQNLSQESAFSGTAFRTFKMSRGEERQVKVDFSVKAVAENGD